MSRQGTECLQFEWPIYDENGSETVYKVNVDVDWDREVSGWAGAVLTQVTLNGEEIPLSRWSGIGLNDPEIDKIVEHAFERMETDGRGE